MAKPNFETFLDLVERSGLVEKDQFQAALAQIQAQSSDWPPSDVDVLAQRLCEQSLLTRWQCDRLLEGRHRGFFLGKLKLLDHLGTGGMSTVYLAEHVLMQRRVAIKVLPKNRVNDTSYLARFHREAQAAATLDHRNIVRVYDVNNDGELHYIVMEYVEGRDLQQMVKRDGPMSYARAAEFIRQAAEGLAHAHEAGLIHRDIKPANLLVDTRNVVKVLDLGLARFTDEDRASLTVQYDENVLGTADYLPPEQAIDSHGVDARADIYSLGCSLYYLLTGHPPFPDGTLPQRLMAHQKQLPPSILKDRPDAPADLIEICLRMMAKKPADRYQSARDVADVLAGWLADHGHGSRIGSDSGLPSGRTPPARAGQRRDTAEAVREVRAPVKNNPALTDTASDMDRPTLKGVPSPELRSKSGSGERPREKVLPVARPLDESPQGAYPDPLEELLGPSVRNSGPMAAIKPAKPSNEPAAPQAAAAPRSRRGRKTGAPVWAWYAIGGGFAVGLILLLIYVLTRL